MYTIKECSSCGDLYNKSCGCSKGGFIDKFVRDPNKTPDSSQQPPYNCPKCRNLVDGLYCRQCALLQKKLKEVWFTICDEHEIFQDFLNTFESSSDNTNVVNAPQEPFVFNQDPGENSSQSPPHIDHHYCYGCGDSLDDIFCQQCTCESCGNGADIGYNCPPKVSIISNPEPCYNQNIDEFPQTLPSFHPTCYSGDENSFTYDSNLNFVDDSPNPPPQPRQPCYNQDFNFPQNFQNFQQQYPCCESCGGSHETFQCQQVIFYEPCYENCEGPHENFQCQTMNQNFYEPNLCYNSISFDFDRFQPSQFPAIHQPPQETSVGILHDHEKVINSVQTFLRKFNRFSFFKTPKVLLLAWDRVFEIKDAFGNKQYKPEDIQELFRELFNDVQNIHEELVIKSIVDDLVPIPSESEGIPDNMCDVPFCDNSSPLDISKERFKDLFDSNDDSTLIDDDSFSTDNIDYVEASAPHFELIILEEIKDFHPEDGELEDNVLHESYRINLLIAKIEALNANPNPSFDFVFKSFSLFPNSFLEETDTSDNSLLESKIFCFDIEEKNSGSTTIHIDISLSDFDHFHFKIEPDPGELTSIVDSGIRENVLSPTNVNLSPEDDQSLLFAYVVWIFLPFFRVSHRSGTFMKFNVYPNLFNESPMKILSSLAPHGPMSSRSSQAQDSVNKNKRFVGGNPCLSLSFY
nr:hypothetical protein [Tanacetum cinerariifolium]